MGLKYGQKWTSQFETEAVQDYAEDMWARDLEGISPMQMKEALDKLVDEHPSWPPTVGEFKILCKGSSNWENQSHLMLPDKSSYSITADERQAMLEKHMPDLKAALNS